MNIDQANITVKLVKEKFSLCGEVEGGRILIVSINGDLHQIHHSKDGRWDSIFSIVMRMFDESIRKFDDSLYVSALSNNMSVYGKQWERLKKIESARIDAFNSYYS